MKNKEEKPDHKYDRGDLVRYKGEYYCVQNAGSLIKIGDDPWFCVYYLCPLNKSKTKPDMRSWDKYGYGKMCLRDVSEKDIELIERGFYIEIVK